MKKTTKSAKSKSTTAKKIVTKKSTKTGVKSVKKSTKKASKKPEKLVFVKAHTRNFPKGKTSNRMNKKGLIGGGALLAGAAAALLLLKKNTETDTMTEQA